MSRAPLSVERIHSLADDYSVTVDGGKSHAGSKNWTVPEFFALLSAPPCRYESLVTYYGVYSSSHRGKCKLENREERVEKIVVEAVPVSSAARQPSNWAKWIMRGTCRWNRKFSPIWKRQLKERLFQPLEPQLSGLWSISPIQILLLERSDPSS